jgi:GT2 family glycosyltransferase
MNEISFHKISDRKSSVFSILIPTWNNLSLLQLCIESIRNNSVYAHQIIVHVNEGKDDTIAFLQSQKIDYTFSKENIGICKAVNACRSLAETELLVYMNDDMYVCPNWDEPLFNEVQSLGHPYFFLSSVMIEPRETGNNCVIAPHDFGTDPSNFREADLIKEFNTFPFHDFSGTTWPPSLIHVRLWDIVGGFSLEFSPGMYSDPDLCMKLWLSGVRYFKGISASRVYHFMSKSTGRIKKNDGKKQFLKKWGFSASYFMREILNRGDIFKGPTPDKEFKIPFKDKMKKLFS